MGEYCGSVGNNEADHHNCMIHVDCFLSSAMMDVEEGMMWWIPLAGQGIWKFYELDTSNQYI